MRENDKKSPPNPPQRGIEEEDIEENIIYYTARKIGKKFNKLNLMSDFAVCVMKGLIYGATCEKF